MLLLTLARSFANAQTYSLESATTIKVNGLYVFEQDGYVMDNTIVKGSLLTTNSYKTEGLSGEETYVWTLIKKNNAEKYRMRNVALYAKSEKSELYNVSGTNLGFESANKGIYWTFDFLQDGTAIIRQESDIYLGYTSKTSHQYRAYTYNSNLTLLENEPYAITIYELVSTEQTDIRQLPHRDGDILPPLYNLQGQRITKPKKGQLYLRKGKISYTRN